MKQAFFLGDSRKRIRDFPKEAKQATGVQLNRVQFGLEPKSWKPMNSIGPSVKEIRIKVEGEYRVIYLATLPENVYVLHAFVKKTPRTSKPDLELAKARYKQLMEAKK